jgi:hypothetical protein
MWPISRTSLAIARSSYERDVARATFAYPARAALSNRSAASVRGPPRRPSTVDAKAVKVSAAACARACADRGSLAPTRRISSAAADTLAAASVKVWARCAADTRTVSSTPVLGPVRVVGLTVPHRMRSFGNDRSAASRPAPNHTGSPVRSRSVGSATE